MMGVSYCLNWLLKDLEAVEVTKVAVVAIVAIVAVVAESGKMMIVARHCLNYLLKRA
ncbi:MAG TPA: hypothetical protein VHV10_19955 [Ktedonobacteraceae bacterium]|nr:hypothetical protein [Ktedonobacteraceae bacterium]